MGTWGDGLFDSDAALDLVAEHTKAEEQAIAKLGGAKPSAKRAEELAARVGLLLQLAPFAFTKPAIAEVAQGLTPAFGGLRPAARELLRRVAEGEGDALAERRGKRSKELRQALGGYLCGKREPSLFASPAGEQVLQRFADRCLRGLEGSLRCPDLEELQWSGGMALLGLLLLVEPPRVPGARLSKGLARLERLWAKQQRKGELAFWDRFVPNARLAFELALLRHGTSDDAAAIRAARKERQAAARAAARAAAQDERARAKADAARRRQAEGLARGRVGAAGTKRIELSPKRLPDARARALLAELAGVIVGQVPQLTHSDGAHRDDALGVVLTHELSGNPAAGWSVRFALELADTTLELNDCGWDPVLSKVELTVTPCDDATQRALRAAGLRFLGK
ncbi:MAG: hypothetical protein AB7N76_13710 [Planctomycetota bacterium]